MVLKGSIVALVTPMEPDGSLDLSAWRRLVEWHCAQGSDALVVGGTTGESATLSRDELCELLQTAADTVKGQVPIVAGVGGPDTRRAACTLKAAADCGADAALAVTPYYNRPPQRGMVAHFQALADTGTLPLILYNVPARTGSDLLPAAVAQLAAHEAIIGIKEASTAAGRLDALLALARQYEFRVYSGDDPTACTSMLAGAHGAVTVAGNVFPAAYTRLCRAAVTDHRETALHLDRVLRPLYRLLSLDSNPIAVKWCLHRMRRADSGIRLPLMWMEPELEDEAGAILARVEDELNR